MAQQPFWEGVRHSIAWSTTWTRTIEVEYHAPAHIAHDTTVTSCTFAKPVAVGSRIGWTSAIGLAEDASRLIT